MAKQGGYPFPQDEFDVLGSNRVPQGVHRAPRPRWRALLPFLLALILAPTIAYLGVSYLSNLRTPASSPTFTASPEPTETVVSPTPTETPTPTPTPTPEILRDAQVFVLNGAAVQGLAGRTADAVEADGFTLVTAGNYAAAEPAASTVFYTGEDLRATAEHIAGLLGIEPVVEQPAEAPAVTVVLRQDFTS